MYWLCNKGEPVHGGEAFEDIGAASDDTVEIRRKFVDDAKATSAGSALSVSLPASACRVRSVPEVRPRVQRPVVSTASRRRRPSRKGVQAVEKKPEGIGDDRTFSIPDDEISLGESDPSSRTGRTPRSAVDVRPRCSLRRAGAERAVTQQPLGEDM